MSQKLAEQRRSTTTHTEAVPNKGKTDDKQFFAEASDKKQLTYLQNKDTGQLLNDPDAMLKYMKSSFQEQAKPASGSAKTGSKTGSIRGKMVHTAVSTPVHY